MATACFYLQVSWAYPEARAVTFKTSAKSFKSQRASNTWEDGGTEKKKKFWLTAKVHVTQEEFGGTDAEASFSSVRRRLEECFQFSLSF